MLYRACSRVSDEELESAKKSLREIDPTERVAQFIYHDPLLAEAPFVKEIRKVCETACETGEDHSPREGETDKNYSERMETSKARHEERIISAIQRRLQEFITPSEEAHAAEGAQALALPTTCTIM